MTTTLPNRIIKYFVDTSNPSQSGFYFYEKAGTGGFVRLGALADASRAGGNTFEIDSSTAENVIYNGLGGADTYVVRSNLDKNIEISDPHTGDDGSGNEAKNTIVFDSDVTVTSINQVTRLEEADILRIELTLDTGAVITVNGPDVFQYVVGGATALDFAGFIATYGASGITPANRAPVIENVSTDLSIDENVDGSAAPVSVGYVVASDADASDSLTYSIVSAVDQNGGSVTGFEVDGAGLVTYVGTGLDAETITSVTLTVSASDGQDSTETSVAISVTNIDEGNARFVVTSDGDITAAAVGDVLTVRTISADPDGNDAFTYQWYRDGAEIADATGASYTIPEDYNRNSIYVVVRYTDGSGTNEVVTLSGIIVPVPEDNADRDTPATLPATPAVLNLADLTPATGFRVDDENAYPRSSREFSSVGDINGDGYDDFAIGVWWADTPNGYDSGLTYVVFGKADGSNDLKTAYFDLIRERQQAGEEGYGVNEITDLPEHDGSDSFRIDGGSGWNWSGKSISAGDVNGDGYNDIIIGASGAGSNGHRSGSTYVVFGKESGFSSAIDLSELDGNDGFRIDGENTGDQSGFSVSSGDVNGDGYDDIIIGARWADPNGDKSGSSYVVFGKASGLGATVELSDIVASGGSAGFRLDGENTGDESGLSVSSAGDVNDDGYDDITIKALNYSYVVYGHATSVTDSEEDTATPANIIVKYFVDTSNPSQSGFYFYEKDGDDNLVRLGRAHEGTLGGDDTFEIDSPTAENVIYNGLGGADTYVIRGRLDNDVQIHDIDFGDDGSGNEVKNTIVFASDVMVTSIYQDRLQDRADVIKIEQTLDTDAVVTVHVPDAFEYVVGGAAALDFAEFIATYGASGISATNRAPVFENEPTDLSIDENADGSAAPVSVGRVVASDADAGDTLTYSIVSTADQNGDSVTGFEVDGTGLITYVGTGLDAETITSVALTVSASDGQESAETSVAISVTNIDEGNARFVVTSDGDITAAAVGDVLTVGTRSADPDGNDAFTYQWYRDGAEIADATGASYTIPEDYNRNSIYVVVRYTDGSGTNEVVTLSGIIVPVPVDNADSSTTATPAVLNLADLTPATGFRLIGDKFASAVSSVGDINGDGYDDFAIGAPRAEPNGEDSGATYVVFGKASGFSRTIELSELDGSDGFRIDGESAGDLSGSSVSASDFNGDGYDDIIIGAHQADPNGVKNSGSTYIVFGKESGFSGTIDLSNIVRSGSGVRIDGEKGYYSGNSVSAGDVNGDGYDDIIIGAPGANFNNTASGSAYVVFGKADGSNGLNGTIELSELDGSDGFRIDGDLQNFWIGWSVSAGDVNGDGYDDVIIGSPFEKPSADPNGDYSGSTYVIFGKESGFSRTMDLSELDGSDGFRIDGENRYHFSGDSVSAGDINGDGYDDIIIGAFAADLNGHNSGSTYVVFGKESGFSRTMDLSELDGSDGFRINGENAGDYSGDSVSSAGDFNGDGYDDIIIGADEADSNGERSGSTYVVFGKESGFSRVIELSELDGSDGFRIDGENTGERSGYFVSSAGDINNDGYDDIIIETLPTDDDVAGYSYVIYGHATSGASGITSTNRAPVFENEPTDLSINENADGSAAPVSVGRVVASDADAADTLTYSIVSTADQNGDSVTGFEVDGTGLITYVGTGLDAETITSVALTVSASDGEDSAQTSVAIFVADLNDVAPTITSGATGNALTENTAVPNTQVIYTATGTSDVTDISWSLSGPDAGLFNIGRATGEVRFDTETTPDAESKGNYSFTVVATSGGLPSVTQNVTIEVTNIDEGNASFVVTSDGDITAAVAGHVLTVGLTSSDPDGDGPFTYQWYRDGVDIAGATGASYTIPEDYDGNSIYVAVRYTDGSGADEIVTASGIIITAPVDNGGDIVPAPPPSTLAVLNLADLNPATSFRLDGENEHDFSGISVSSVGDINGDGYDDFAIGASGLDPNGDYSGSTYVIFGKESDFSRTTELSELDGNDGFHIDGENIGDSSGYSISAGDVNGDGYNDVIIGALAAEPNGGNYDQLYNSGATYVVFGKESGFSGTIDLSDVAGDGGGGFRINGENKEDYSGFSVASGDVNRDGYDDIIIGAYRADPNGNGSGSTYVVFGKENGFDATIELSDIVASNGSDGFRIDGENKDDFSGKSVSSGDVNGDGYDDIIIGAYQAEPNVGNFPQYHDSGSTYVVFGKESGFSRTTDLSELDGSDGFRIDGTNTKDLSGWSVSSAGDVNNDGYDDIIIGAHYADPNGDKSGASYIVFGKEGGFSTTIELSELDGSDGFRIDGASAGDKSGSSVSSAGDFNGDGYDDIIIGAPHADPNGPYSGASYVIFGKESGFSRTIDLSELDGSDGFRIDGANQYDWTGYSVSSAGDVNNDGYDDIIIGAHYAEGTAGYSYVIYGHATSGASGIISTNRTPVFENEPTDLSINENADGSAVPVSVGRVVASDADAADTLTYSIVSTADQNGDSVTGFEVDGTGLITYVGTGLDAETITSVALTVSASDGQESAQTLVAISVTNIDEGNASFVVTSNDDITAAVAGDVLTVALRSSDPDGDGTFSYQWYRDGVDIAGATGASYTITEADGGNSLYVAVRYTDGSGADEIVTASGIIIPVPSDNIAPATPAVLNLADLDPTVGFRLIGEDDDFGDSFGSAVSSVGDINGDGHDDFAIGANLADPNGYGSPNGYGRYDSGSTYVVFGKESDFSGAIDLSELDGSDGFRIDGEGEFKRSGYSVSASDINGDGYNDIIIGAPGDGGYSGGATYVVFGKESGFSGTVDLSNIVRSGSGGVRIDVENADPFDGTSYWSGRSVSAGDINGDGYDDVIIGAWGADSNEYYAMGSTYVVFGRSDGSNGLSGTIDLSELDGSDGFRIDGENANDKSGLSVSAGDVNGDGYDDIIIGAWGAEPNVGNFPHYYDSGSTYVVFGKEGRFDATIELSDIVASDGSDGFRINGESASDGSGFSVSSAGDINGDGYDDIIIGARYAGPNGDESGASYVVFGNDDDAFAATMNLSELDGSDGFRINGESARDGSGYSVSSAGDFNGDGYDDVIIGARYADPNGYDSGSTYVVFGKESGFSRVIELSELDGGDGFRIDGENTGDQSGRSVSSAGDVNGDGYDDIIIGAPRTDGVAGYSYVIYGHATSVTNIDEGNASFVVTSDRDINAAVAGDVLTVALRTSDPDGDGTFTYQWYRDGVDIAGATGASYTIPEDYDGNSIYVVVRYTDGSGTDETITASGVIVPVLADNDDDASEDPVNTTYTMMQAPTGVSLTRGGVALSVGETFTYQDIQGGSVALTVNDENALSGLRLTTDDGTDANPAEISLDIEVREVADIAAPEAGNDLDYSENEGSLVIDTGDYGDQITAAQGSDFITGGLGDDTINLDPIEGRETGQDTVVYNFGSGSIFTATDGGDDITGFKRGEDIFLLKTESDNPELATLDGLFSYVSGPNKGSSHDDLMIVRPNYEYEPDGSGGLNFFLTGIEFHFEDGGVYGNGYLAQGHVSITFDERLPWEEFLSLIEIDNGNGSIDGNFDHRRGIIRDLSTLPNLMGEGSLAYEVEAPAQTPPQDVDVVPLEDDIPATSFDVV